MKQSLERTAIMLEMFDRVCSGCIYTLKDYCDCIHYPNTFMQHCKDCKCLEGIDNILDSLPDNTTYSGYFGYSMPDVLREYLKIDLETA